MMVELPVINKGVQKTKCRRLKSQSSVTTMEDETIFSRMPIKSIPPVLVDHAKIVDSGGAAGDDNMLVAEDMVTENVEGPSTEGLGANVGPSVKDAMDGWKDSTSLEGDVLEPSVANPIAEGMDTDIPSVDDFEPATVETTDTAGQEEIETIDLILRPKKKLRKEERAAKRARKVERRARKATEAKTAQENDFEEVMPEETEEVIPPVVQPSVDDEWLTEHEPEGDNEDD
ncbi:hypothetical protein LIER_11594 [Lithospermum erythrorhizon]|uniref:Uncharacterized protein n=1 Tax=Lithospermum erythrorhizon TaxID=34254 RepID=A0AAV3PTR0_LITER